jgi:alpha-glutamyl/putrescinyl thymine pyrophosphorylase clade 1
VQLGRREDVYRTYWTFAAERQRIFQQRVAGDLPPWTSDTILQRYKFCNAYRASDRVSQYLIANVIYGAGEFSPDDTLLRIIFFRLFSKPSTWATLEQELGPIRRRSFRGQQIATCLEQIQANGDPIYTGAFILCANRAFGFDRKHLNHIALVEQMFRRRALPRAIAAARCLQDVYEALLAYPLIGPFMAYQLAIDINYSELVDFSESEFTVPGPGSERGIRKCFPTARRAEMPSVIHWMVEQQYAETTRLGIDLPTLWGRPLQAIDCQNLFCELDKYARVAFPELKSNRSRIKTAFSPSAEPLPLFYPPKWGINEQISSSSGVQPTCDIREAA